MTFSRLSMRPLAVLLCAFGMAGAADAQTATSGTRSDSAAAIASADRTFLLKAAADGMAEVELSRLAQQQAGSEQVRQFAARIVQDHTAAHQDLIQIAANKGVPLPTELTAAQQRRLETLRHLNGAAFDREYMRHMVGDHHKDYALFQKQAKSSQDSDVQGFASKTLPVLQEHERLAQSLQTDMRATPPNQQNTAP